jgi:hypothetical protein
LNQFFGIRKRQRPQQNRIHYAENRGVRPNPKGKNNYRRSSKPWILAQRAESIAKIL